MVWEDGAAYINGEFCPIGEAKISVLDSGFMLGACVYDTLSSKDGYVFKLPEHVDRFYRSTHSVRIDLPLSKDDFKGVIVETVRRSGLRDTYIQLVATRGVRSDGPVQSWKPTLIVYVIPYFSILSDEVVRRGAKVRISSIRHVPPQCLDPKIKNFNRLHMYLARLEATDAGADDVLLLTLDGYVSEGRGANVFAFKDGKLITPSENVLLGITRETVFEIARAERMEAVEGRLTPYDLYTADEVFFSTTAGAIMPIVEVDGRKIGDGKPGPVTKRIEERYWKMHVSPEHSVQAYSEAPARV